MKQLTADCLINHGVQPLLRELCVTAEWIVDSSLVVTN